MIVNLKTEEEIKGFKKVGKETARIFNNIIVPLIGEGQTGIEIDNLVKNECKRINANPIFLNYRNYPASICVSVNNTLVHGIPNNIPFKFNDIISVDFGLEIDGFIGDMADTIYLNEYDYINETEYDIQIKSMNFGCKMALIHSIVKAKDGNKLSDISSEIDRLAKSYNCLTPNQYGGHGIDRNVLHSTPFIPNFPDYENDFTLREGMILAIEPMFISAKSNNLKILSDGWSVVAEGPTAHCEHTVLVGKDKGIILTKEYDDERPHYEYAFNNW